MWWWQKTSDNPNRNRKKAKRLKTNTNIFLIWKPWAIWIEFILLLFLMFVMWPTLVSIKDNSRTLFPYFLIQYLNWLIFFKSYKTHSFFSYTMTLIQSWNQSWQNVCRMIPFFSFLIYFNTSRISSIVASLYIHF